MRLLIIIAVFIAYAIPAYAVPLAEWEADEAKLLGEEPVTLEDLPDEWQELSEDELILLIHELDIASQVHFNANRIREGVKGFKQVLLISRYLQSGTADHTISVIFIANGLDSLCEYSEAYIFYSLMKDDAKEIGNPGMECIALRNLGSLANILGLFDNSMKCWEELLQHEHIKHDSYSESYAWIGLGNTYLHLDKHDLALDCYRTSYDIASKISDEKRRVGVIGTVLENLASVSTEIGEYEQAILYYVQASELFEKQNLQVSLCQLYYNMGVVYSHMADMTTAIEYYQSALELAEEYDEVLVECASLEALGSYHYQIGQYSDSIDYYNKSLELVLLHSIGNRKRKLLVQLGHMYHLQGDYQSSLEFFQRGYDVALSQSCQFAWETGLKHSLVAALCSSANQLVHTQLQLSKCSEAFQTLQSSKGFPLLQLLTQAQVQTDDPEVQEVLSSYRKSNAMVHAYRQQLLDTSEDDSDKQASINDSIGECQAKANDAWDYMRENAPEITDIISVKGLTVEEVQDEVLQDGQIVLEYMATDEAVYIFCLPKEGELNVAYAEMPDLGETEFSDWLHRRIELLYAPEHQQSDQAAKTLYDLLIEPVEDYIPAGAELIICPDRELFIVPFEALMDDELLLDQHSITYSTSATMLSYIDPAGGAEGVLIAGVSFGAGDDDNAILLENRSTDLVRGHTFAKNLPALPGVIDETKEIAAIYGIKPLLDEQVTEVFLRQSMPGHRVIHLATHGYLSDISLLNGVVVYLPGSGEAASERDVPMLPGGDDDINRDVPMLPGGDEDLSRDVPMLPAGDDDLRGNGFLINTNDDGFLTMAEVMGIPLSGCELVTLSACHSAEGDVAPGEGVMGLSQGFMYAGARSILASLTKVDDTATRLLMVEFYQNWNGGMTKRDALRAAKQTMIESGYAAPKYWAPFVLYGVE